MKFIASCLLLLSTVASASAATNSSAKTQAVLKAFTQAKFVEQRMKNFHRYKLVGSPELIVLTQEEDDDRMTEEYFVNQKVRIEDNAGWESVSAKVTIAFPKSGGKTVDVEDVILSSVTPIED